MELIQRKKIKHVYYEKVDAKFLKMIKIDVKLVRQIKFYLMKNVQVVAKMVIITMVANVINVFTSVKL